MALKDNSLINGQSVRQSSQGSFMKLCQGYALRLIIKHPGACAFYCSINFLTNPSYSTLFIVFLI